MKREVEFKTGPVKSALSDHTINVGDEVIFVSLRYKTVCFARGIFLGTRVVTKTGKRWNGQEYISTVSRYAINSNGRKTYLHYPRMVPVSADVTVLENVRI